MSKFGGVLRSARRAGSAKRVRIQRQTAQKLAMHLEEMERLREASKVMRKGTPEYNQALQKFRMHVSAAQQLQKNVNQAATSVAQAAKPPVRRMRTNGQVVRDVGKIAALGAGAYAFNEKYGNPLTGYKNPKHIRMKDR